MKKIGIVLNEGVNIEDCKISIPEVQLSNSFYNHFLENKIQPILIASNKENAEKTGSWDINSEKTFLLGSVPANKYKKIFFYLHLISESFFINFPDTNYIFLPGNVSYSILPAIMIRNIPFGIYLRGEIRTRTVFSELLFKLVIKTALKKANFIVAAGKATANFAKQFNENVEEVVPMMNVSKENLFKRESHELSNSLKILFLSRIEKEKGIYETIEAAKSLIDEGNDISLEIVGGGSDEEILKVSEMIENYKERIKLHGKISEKEKIHDIFRKADIYIFPSYHEGFPRVLYEAMTFAIPIITTDISGTKGVMIDNENCLKVSPKSYLELKNAIKTLINDEELRKKIGTNGYQFMEKFFEKIDGDSHAKQVLRWIEKTKKVIKKRII